jgi:hypothetical protein
MIPYVWGFVNPQFLITKDSSLAIGTQTRNQLLPLRGGQVRHGVLNEFSATPIIVCGLIYLHFVMVTAKGALDNDSQNLLHSKNLFL